ncbi:sigma-54-dependent Fis family transcriptional regulator [Roseibium polysiphoniae]|uniref:Sigma-54-dependent Fis family transcriptional regulator n=1 Tax=Roseibium polysiphoniae TaxID=2571221 RepID=A0A944CGC2_9HYPH|nr:sigma-54 dependent transcriptional regulator [Roseibium polysiphoniae]MBS8261468.1 sigma-54-dependent Fis family transcriptional regulator [Roseibium polysiphoniae]
MTAANAKTPVLIVDDDPAMRSALRQWLGLAGFDTIEVPDADTAMRHVQPSFPGCVVSDVMLNGDDGVRLMKRIAEIDADIPVILITGHGDVPMAVDAMRSGAYDFVEKPFDPEVIAELVRRACEKRSLVLENRSLSRRLVEEGSLERRLLGNSPAMRALRERLLHFAGTDAAVLITGETGTGKEVVAQALHAFGHRKDAPFVAINAAALPETMVEAELFGHEAGAFTGADRTRIGRIEAANGGVLFLDEIVSMPIPLQPKLLRVLQEKCVDRIGGRRPVPVDFRVVSAANIEPKEAVAAKTLREDLLFRLNTIEITIPPLRERGNDSLLLFDTFINRFATQYGIAMLDVTARDEAFLRTYDWPGNVRELRNAAERFVLNAGVGRQPLEVLVIGPGHKVSDIAGGTLKDLMDSYERSVISNALRRHEGRIAEVMRELGVPRRTLNEKMTRLKLSRPQVMGDE